MAVGCIVQLCTTWKPNFCSGRCWHFSDPKICLVHFPGGYAVLRPKLIYGRCWGLKLQQHQGHKSRVCADLAIKVCKKTSVMRTLICQGPQLNFGYGSSYTIMWCVPDSPLSGCDATAHRSFHRYRGTSLIKTPPPPRTTIRS